MSGSSVVDVDVFTQYQIPNEILSGIFSYLSVADLLRAGAACKGWQALSEDTGLWKEKCLKLGIDMHSLPPPPQHAQPGPIYQRSPWKSVFIRHSLVKRNWGSDDPQYCKQLVGHTDSVTAIVVRGDHVITAADDTSVKVWCTVTGQCVHDWGLTVANVDRFRVKEMLVSENAVAVSYQYVQQGPTHCHCIKVFSINNGLCLKSLEALYGVEMVLYKSVFAVVFDDALCIWSVQDEALRLEHRCVQERVGPMGIGCDGTHVVTRDRQGVVKLWHIETGLCAKIIQTDAPHYFPPSLRVVQCGNARLLLCLEGGHDDAYVLSTFDLHTHTRLYTITLPPMNGVLFLLSNDRLYIASPNMIDEYNAATGRFMRGRRISHPDEHVHRLKNVQILAIGVVVIGVHEPSHLFREEPDAGLRVYDTDSWKMINRIALNEYALSESSVFDASATALVHISNDDSRMCVMHDFNVPFP